MSSFKTILCPIDLGPNTDATLETAQRLAEESGAKLILFHVVPLPVEMVGQPLLVEPLSFAQDEARTRIELLAKRLGLKVAYEVVVVIGDPAREIVRAVGEHEADLVVMATHGRTGLSHLFLGSVAARVVRDSSVPVLTVPMRNTRQDNPAQVAI
ncbi:MAG TPA: universal stress protein [Candidatus Binataceae bacterium]|nr:universal stress protein [Candidatus Binataceae bacterium]